MLTNTNVGLFYLKGGKQMPYKSEAQRKFFNSSGAKKAGISEEEKDKWNKESKGQKDLPEKVSDDSGTMKNFKFKVLCGAESRSMTISARTPEEAKAKVAEEAKKLRYKGKKITTAWDK